MPQYLDRLAVDNSTSTAVNLMQRAARNPKSKKYAMVARCVQCEHGVDDEGWHERIRNCRAKCALHALRPYQAGDEDDGADKPFDEQASVGTSFDPAIKALSNPKSRRLAINAYCWDCMGGGKQANVQRTIQECGISGCMIHPVRPYQQKPASDEDEHSVTNALMCA